VPRGRPAGRRPDPPRGILRPRPVPAPTPPPRLAGPRVALVHGRVASDPVPRREFHRTDTILIRAATAGEPGVSARLLNHPGQPPTALPVAQTPQGPPSPLPLGSPGAAAYAGEMTARGNDQMAQQFVASRLAAR